MDEFEATSFRDQIDDLLPELIIHTIQFDHAEETIEVTFAELRDQAVGAGMLKTIAFEKELFAPEVVSIESDLRDLIDEVLIHIRNEDARQARIDKAIARNRVHREDEDDDSSDTGVL
jgi:hypothetical protein